MVSFTDWPWRHWRAQCPGKPALRLDEETLTWQQLGDRVDGLAAGFHHQGVQEGDGVMLLAHNHPQTLLAWLALLQCGARILPVNPQLPRPLLDVLLPQMTLRFALVLDGIYEGLTALQMAAQPGEYVASWQPERLASMTSRRCRVRRGGQSTVSGWRSNRATEQSSIRPTMPIGKGRGPTGS